MHEEAEAQARLQRDVALHRRDVIATAIVTAIILLVYLPVFTHSVTVWSTDEEFSFAFLVPPIAAGLLWMRRRAILASLGTGSALGVGVLLAGLALLIVSARLNVHFIGGASFLLTALGAAVYLFGLGTGRTLLFPFGFLTFSLVLYRGLLNTLGFRLQTLTAHYSAATASLIGVPVHRSGVDLFVGQFHFVVAEACSGMNSLLALLCLGSLIVGLAQGAIIRRIILMILIVPIVLAANITRVALVLTLAQAWPAVASGFVHGFFSAALFLVALSLFILAGGLLKCYPRIDAMA